jgi:hypothetical protein
VATAVAAVVSVEATAEVEVVGTDMVAETATDDKLIK